MVLRTLSAGLTVARRTLRRALIVASVPVCLASLAGTATTAATAQEPVTVFAAASLTDAMTAATDAWTAATGIPVRLSFASSSTLARQIEAGAPADLFASANEGWMDYLADRDAIDSDARTSPLANALVLVAPRAAVAEDTPETEVTATLVTDRLGAQGRLAVGDPDHVPAGQYARQALESLGLWEDVEPRLARADNVRGALALVSRGEAPVGIVYATDAGIDAGVAILGRFGPDTHAPITYPFAPTAGASSTALELLAFLTGPEAAAVFSDFGFVPTR